MELCHCKQDGEGFEGEDVLWVRDREAAGHRGLAQRTKQNTNKTGDSKWKKKIRISAGQTRRKFSF